MKFKRVFKWTFSTYKNTDTVYFNFIQVAEHFKGFDRGGFRIELITSKSWYGFSFKRGFDSMKNCFKDSDAAPHINIRWNKPLIRIGLFDPVKQFHLVNWVEVE